jgi:hypothetical protein
MRHKIKRCVCIIDGRNDWGRKPHATLHLFPLSLYSSVRSRPTFKYKDVLRVFPLLIGPVILKLDQRLAILTFSLQN